MTGKTFSCCLAGNMRFVAFGAIRNQAVDVMTECTGYIRVFAWVVLHFKTLVLVACQAGTGYITGNLEVEGLMRVGVAAHTIFKLIMGLSGMAHGTCRDGICSFRGMLNMAIKAGNVGLMLFAVFLYGSRFFRVAFNTV